MYSFFSSKETNDPSSQPLLDKSPSEETKPPSEQKMGNSSLKSPDEAPPSEPKKETQEEIYKWMRSIMISEMEEQSFSHVSGDGKNVLEWTIEIDMENPKWRDKWKELCRAIVFQLLAQRYTMGRLSLHGRNYGIYIIVISSPMIHTKSSSF